MYYLIFLNFIFYFLKILGQIKKKSITSLIKTFIKVLKFIHDLNKHDHEWGGKMFSSINASTNFGRGGMQSSNSSQQNIPGSNRPASRNSLVSNAFTLQEKIDFMKNIVEGKTETTEEMVSGYNQIFYANLQQEYLDSHPGSSFFSDHELLRFYEEKASTSTQGPISFSDTSYASFGVTSISSSVSSTPVSSSIASPFQGPQTS